LLIKIILYKKSNKKNISKAKIIIKKQKKIKNKNKKIKRSKKKKKNKKIKNKKKIFFFIFYNFLIYNKYFINFIIGIFFYK